MKNLYKISSEKKFRVIFKESVSDIEEFHDDIVKSDMLSVNESSFSEDQKNALAGLAISLGLNSGIFESLRKIFGEMEEVVDEKDDNGNSAELKEESEDDKNLRKAELSEFIKKGEKLTAENALKSLNPNISIKSTDHGYHRSAELCKKRNSSNTSLEGILPRTISGANFLQKQLGIPLVITGGTEDGHGGGKNGGIGTHGFGSKLDFSFKNGVDSAIKSYIGRSIAFGKGKHNGKKIKTSGKFKGEYETWTINDGGYEIVITRETKVPGKEHYDIKFS